MTKNDTNKERVALVDPFECRMWESHDRFKENITEESCRDLIESFQHAGQKQPVLVRPLTGAGPERYELIYGARRLFAARHLNQKLLARIRKVDDQTALREIDIENRLRRDISPYERGMSFRAWIHEGYFRSQDELARNLRVSKAQVCRLMKFSELPNVVIAAFPDPCEIKEAWAVTLAERCSDSKLREKILATARSLKRAPVELNSKQTYKLLLNSRKNVSTAHIDCADKVIRSSDGKPLFRISHRCNDVHVIIPKRKATAAAVRELSKVLSQALQNADCCTPSDRSRASDWSPRAKRL